MTDATRIESEHDEEDFAIAIGAAPGTIEGVQILLRDDDSDIAVSNVSIDKAREIAETLIKVAHAVELNAVQRQLKPGDKVTTEAQLDRLLILSAVRTLHGNVAIKAGARHWDVTGISRSLSHRELLAYGELTILYNRSLENGGIA